LADTEGDLGRELRAVNRFSDAVHEHEACLGEKNHKKTIEKIFI
jgi:hypothetical protein